MPIPPQQSSRRRRPSAYWCSSWLALIHRLHHLASTPPPLNTGYLLVKYLIRLRDQNPRDWQIKLLQGGTIYGEIKMCRTLHRQFRWSGASEDSAGVVADHVICRQDARSITHQSACPNIFAQ